MTFQQTVDYAFMISMKDLGEVNLVLLLFFVFGLSSISIAQKESEERLVVGSDLIAFQVVQIDTQQFDSIYFVTPWKTGLQSDWTFFYDENRKNICLHYSCDDDTCTTTNYYRNGRKKSTVITYSDLYVLFESFWYDNDQLYYEIHPLFETETITEYYRTGERLRRYTMFNLRTIGKYEEWYISGQVRQEGEYDTLAREVGLWRTYNSDGELVEKQIYDRVSK